MRQGGDGEGEGSGNSARPQNLSKELAQNFFDDARYPPPIERSISNSSAAL